MKKNISILMIVIIVSFSVVIMFSNKYFSLLQEFETKARTKEALLSRYIDLCNGYIELLTVYGMDFLEHNNAPESPLMAELQYDPALDRYHSDHLMISGFSVHNGSLTGSGRIPEDLSDRQEINLAFHLNESFRRIYEELPEAAWLYYTSENNFILMYPWIASEDFRFSEALQKEVFYQDVAPNRNPLRKSLWTPVYLDHAGKGMMVTLSSPVYRNDSFAGVVSIDLTNETLSSLLTSVYEVSLSDETDSVIATNLPVDFKNEVIKLDNLLQTSSEGLSAMKRLPRQEVRRLESYYIYSAQFDHAPWNMVFRVPVKQIAYHSLLHIFPILAIGSLLIYTVLEISRRKRAEVLQQGAMEALLVSQKQLEDSARSDYLTSVFNRRGFREWYEHLHKTSATADAPLSVLLGDIDHFKTINDTYGHGAGDRVLMEVGKIFQRHITPRDAVCRWGGEEFLILLPGQTAETAVGLAETIRREIAGSQFAWENTSVLKTTMTFGVAESDLATSLDEVILKADSALYKGKQSGRNITVSFHEIE